MHGCMAFEQARNQMCMQQDVLTPKESEEVAKSTSLAEHGNASRLRDLLHEEKDLGQHNKIIKAMLNLNQQHLHTFELQEKAGQKPDPVGKLKFEEIPRDVNGDLIITRSLSKDGKAIYREVYNSSKKVFEDSGSVTRPSGIIPQFIPHKD